MDTPYRVHCHSSCQCCYFVPTAWAQSPLGFSLYVPHSCVVFGARNVSARVIAWSFRSHSTGSGAAAAVAGLLLISQAGK